MKTISKDAATTIALLYGTITAIQMNVMRDHKTSSCVEGIKLLDRLAELQKHHDIVVMGDAEIVRIKDYFAQTINIQSSQKEAA